MKLKILIAILFIFLNVIVYGDINYDEEKWSSNEPLSIPLKIRLEQLNKKNLIQNYSFESVNNILNNWKIIGSNVFWVNKNNKKFKNEDVFSGKRSIKIERKKIQDETEKLGEGVLSDFISVIPGNYLFTYSVRLENIYPNRWRLGTKLFDSINIRMFFYDKDKKKIDPKVYYPYYDAYIDNSFKGYSFSNFWNIEKFPWAKVRGRTYNYPFSEGDIPDNCRFVKIFLGLKGRGEMWVDNVDLRYSKWNFTSKERISKYFNKKMSKGEMLVPKPKEISKKNELIEFNNKEIFIYTNKTRSNTLNTAIELLKEKIGEKIIITDNIFDIKKNSIVFSLGNIQLSDKIENKLKKLKNKIKDKKQAYFIDKPLMDKPLFVLNGNTDIGVYYAVTTLVQLIDSKNKTYTHYNIIDYPDFLGRSFLFTDLSTDEKIANEKDGLLRMSKYKLNKVYNSYGDWGKDWKNPKPMYIKGLKEIGKSSLDTGVVDLALMVHPYMHFKYEQKVSTMDKKTKYYFSHSDEKAMNALKANIKVGMEAGAKTLMLMADDFVPHETDYRKIYSLWNDKDKQKFTNLQNAQAFMINSIYNWLDKDYPNTRFEFCPPWYLNEFIDKSRGKAEQHFSDLVRQIPEDVAIIWTGNTVRSLSFDMADMERYRKLIGRYPMLWDNTLYARTLSGIYGGYAAYYPGKVVMCNLFEPLDLFLPDNFYKYNDGGHIYFNGAATSEIYKIKYGTVADYTWNNNEYDADLSLWKVLIMNFDKKTSIEIIEFNDIYWKTYNEIMYGERAYLSKKNLIYEKHIKRINKGVNNLKKSLRKLKKLLKNKNKKLLNELGNQIKSLNSRIEKLKKGEGIKVLGKAQI